MMSKAAALIGPKAVQQSLQSMQAARHH